MRTNFSLTGEDIELILESLEKSMNEANSYDELAAYEILYDKLDGIEV